MDILHCSDFALRGDHSDRCLHCRAGGFFGTRRQHPALAAMIERYAYLGGMDGVSCVAGAERTGIEATGTMPHSLIICFGEDRQKEAWKAFDEVIAPEVPRICLCDTYYDEKKEAVMAAEALGESCSPVVSGGINEEDVIELGDVVAGFGGNKRCKIEKEGEPCAKRGKRGGKKQVYRRNGVIKKNDMR